MTYPAPHPPFIAAKYHGDTQNPRRIMLHSTVSSCASGSARATAHYFEHIERKASAHYVVDPTETIQCVKDHTVAYHCGWNQNSIGVEMCEYPSKVNGLRWATKPHRMMRRRAVNLVARLCLAYDIPPVFLTAADLKAGKAGITTHNVVRRAFPQFTTHWDPGIWYRKRFMREVRARIAYLKTTDTWKEANR